MFAERAAIEVWGANTQRAIATTDKMIIFFMITNFKRLKNKLLFIQSYNVKNMPKCVLGICLSCKYHVASVICALICL